jgi:RHS repeat-associated protein
MMITFTSMTIIRGDKGNYYYGARYYDPKVSVWLSVDPILKHHETPYCFTSNNPIMLIDPDGRDTTVADKGLRNIIHNRIANDPEFAQRFQEVAASSTMFNFKTTKEKKSSVTTDGKDVTISVARDGMAPNVPQEAALYEEVEHLTQFLHGEWGFAQNGNGTWTAVGLDQIDEANGFLYALESPSVTFPFGGGTAGKMKRARDEKNYNKMIEISTGRHKDYSGLNRGRVNFDQTQLGQSVINGNGKGLYYPYKSRKLPITRAMTN